MRWHYQHLQLQVNLSLRLKDFTQEATTLTLFPKGAKSLKNSIKVTISALRKGSN